MAFPCVMPNNVCTLNASGNVARQQLLEDIMSLPHTRIPPSSRNVKEAVMAAIRHCLQTQQDIREQIEVFIYCCGLLN